MNELLNLLARAPKGSQLISTPKKAVSGFDPDFLADDSIDPSIRVDAANASVQGELRNRLFQAERTQGPGPNDTSPFEVRALSNLLGGYQKEQASGPLAAQQQTYDKQQALNLDASNSGFTGEQGIEQSTDGVFSARQTMTPIQQREVYKRQQAEANSPIAQARYNNEQENFRQGRQLNQSNRVVMAQMAPAMERAETQRKALEALLRTGDIAGLKSLTKDGFSLQSRPGAPAVNPNTMMTNLQDAQGALGSATPFATWDDPSPEQQFFNRGAMNYMVSQGIDPTTQATLINVLKDPELSVIPLPQLKQMAMTQPGFDERDWAKFEAAYTYFKQGR